MRRQAAALALLVAAGFLLRGGLLLAAENRLDADESTVGVMALDILEGKALPFFFYGVAYNGGGALEAYLAAGLFALLGPSAGAVKLGLLLLWTATAALFADLCRRSLTPHQALLATLFFCVGTPFFLEWSLKARGGFAETALVTVLLLWLATPPPALRRRPGLQSLAFGLATGVGLWASEMVLALVPCAVAWLLVRCGPGRRARAAVGLSLAIPAAAIPLLLYNLGHDWEHLRSSVLYGLVAGSRGSAPLDLAQLRLALGFALGPAWLLIALGGGVAAARAMRERPLHLGHVVAIHTVLYLLAFWISGLRYLPVPPTRVLYALYPGLAILLAWAAAPAAGAPPAWRRVAQGAVALGLLASLAPVVGWARSGEPRETGSWRGSWGLVDGAALYQTLVKEDVRVVYANYWTSWSLRFANRLAAHADPEAPLLEVTWNLPAQGSWAPGRAALVLNPGSPLQQRLERHVARRTIPHRRIEAAGRVILSRIVPAQLDQAGGFPSALGVGDWRPPGPAPDGFN